MSSYMPKLVDFTSHDWQWWRSNKLVAQAESWRVPVASFHLQGDALLWYQLLKQHMDVITWKEFRDELHSFWSSSILPFFFKRTCEVAANWVRAGPLDMIQKFLYKVGHLPQAWQVSYFISGLQEPIQTDMRAGKMTALSAAIGFVQTARLYKLVTSLNEEQIQFQTQLWTE